MSIPANDEREQIVIGGTIMDNQPGADDHVSSLLAQAILSLETEDEVRGFLNDLLTINEIKSMSQRLEIARMLDDNITFNIIATKTGASTATISRVNRCLNYGTGGYRRVLERLKKERKDE
jgi:TrpR-related protein YerC/YecD